MLPPCPCSMAAPGAILVVVICTSLASPWARAGAAASRAAISGRVVFMAAQTSSCGYAARMRPLALALCAALAGCAQLQQLAASAFQRPAVSFKDARLRDVSLGGATVDLVFGVDNPNDQG